MGKTYNITGMTCQGCVKRITEGLQSALPNATIAINLNRGELQIDSKEVPSVEALNQVVDALGPYRVVQHVDQSQSIQEVSNSWFLTYKPLLIIVGFILLLSIGMTFNSGRHTLMAFMQYFMAAFFIIFSLFKLLDLRGFAQSYSSYDLIAKRWFDYGFIYPFLELTFGICLLFGFYLWIIIPGMILVMTISAIGVIRAVLDKQEIKCACLGTTFNLPMSTVTIIEDVTMVAMGMFMWLGS